MHKGETPAFAAHRVAADHLQPGHRRSSSPTSGAPPPAWATPSRAPSRMVRRGVGLQRPLVRQQSQQSQLRGDAGRATPTLAAAPAPTKSRSRLDGAPAHAPLDLLAPAYPDPPDSPASAATLPALPEPRCASPTDCAATRAAHVSGLPRQRQATATAAAPPAAATCDLGGGRAPASPVVLAAALALAFALLYKRRA